MHEPVGKCTGPADPCCNICFFFSNKQPPSEIGLRLVGSELYIRDREQPHATKTPIPEYILQGISEQEYLIQKERELEQELETKVFVVVEQLPEFPDGGQPGMLAFLENAVSEEVRATGK